MSPFASPINLSIDLP
ncbi:hypothetical protein AZE42_08078 [Rhizopogon vesiculosus]|uniref:Uncharacterized protein n=1 Tax=Rhizopogon vesiculosus TaxID=180088 RepID=A0A1J8PNW9_9AGAM|nr:hypothetical protein AZE42_08078 [Rhizopogon vesiculosus]